MRVSLNFAGAVLVVFGGIWFLQGINVLRGSFMTGQIRWAVHGGIATRGGNRSAGGCQPAKADWVGTQEKADVCSKAAGTRIGVYLERPVVECFSTGRSRHAI